MMYSISLWLLEGLDSDELLSVLKSNRISWEDRRLIKSHLTGLIVEESIPIIATVIVASVIIEVVKNSLSGGLNNATQKG